MPALNTGGRNSEQKNQLNSTPSTQVAISETSLLPNTFHFWNGDEYDGKFAVLKDKQKIVMQGRGVYKTADGETYEGLWENDCLKNECKVTFPGRVVFSGELEDMVIQGLGKYSFKGKVEIEGVFDSNSLTGTVDLEDPNHHQWRGKVDKSASCINFYPMHSFWQSVLNLPSKTVDLFYGEAEENYIWEGFY